MAMPRRVNRIGPRSIRLEAHAQVYRRSTIASVVTREVFATSSLREVALSLVTSSVAHLAEGAGYSIVRGCGSCSVSRRLIFDLLCNEVGG